MAEYGATLERLLSARGVSKRALARGLGLSHTLVVRSAAGDRPPADADEVLRTAALLYALTLWAGPKLGLRL